MTTGIAKPRVDIACEKQCGKCGRRLGPTIKGWLHGMPLCVVCLHLIWKREK